MQRFVWAAYCEALTKYTSVSYGLLCLCRRTRARDAEADAELASGEPPARRQRRVQAGVGRGIGLNGAVSPRQAAQRQAGSEAAAEAMLASAADAQAGGLSILAQSYHQHLRCVQAAYALVQLRLFKMASLSMCSTACAIAGQEYAKHEGAMRDARLMSAEAPRPLRRTASTLAAAGNAYAVAGRNTERPTASTGTSRPAARQQRDSQRQAGDSPDGPEQASEHRGGSCQPGAFPVPPPRPAGVRAGIANGNSQRQLAEHPTGCAFWLWMPCPSQHAGMGTAATSA